MTLDTGDNRRISTSCRWCRVVDSQEQLLYGEPAFLVLEDPRRRGSCLTLVTRTHAGVMTDLPPKEMAAVLAGLAVASKRLSSTSGSSGVQIYAHPTGGRRSRGHLHFRLVATSSPMAPSPSEPEGQHSSFASLVETISH